MKSKSAPKAFAKPSTRRANPNRRSPQIKASASAKASEGQTDSIRQRVSKSLKAAARIDRAQLAWGLAGTAAVGAGCYFLYRSWSSGNLSLIMKSIEERIGLADDTQTSDFVGHANEGLAGEIPAGLPLGVSGEKPSPSILDYDGNYDLDGVSYDVQGVVIGSDNHKGINSNV